MSVSELRTAEIGTRTAKRKLHRFAGLFSGGWHELTHATERRVPFLDGLRAFAVLLVVNQHISAAFARDVAPNRYSSFTLMRNGWIGVDLFFVLSGYFIGSQLWKELGRSGTISIKQFMLRRGLRIWPLYFFVFAAVFVLIPGAAAAKQYGWTDLVFITNYTNHGIVSGSWSLCSEEQFYLLAPMALLLIGPRSMRGYRWGLAALLVVVLVVRAATFMVLSGHFFAKDADAFRALYYPFHTHCDGLIAGLLVANLAVSGAQLPGILKRPGVVVLLSLIFLAGTAALQADVFPFTGLAVFFASLVWWGLQSKTELLGQHIFYLLSRLSYGMYLNHEYMQHWVVRHMQTLGVVRMGNATAAACGFAVLAILSMAVSAASFCLIEHPFLMVRTALLRRSVPHLTAH